MRPECALNVRSPKLALNMAVAKKTQSQLVCYPFYTLMWPICAQCSSVRTEAQFFATGHSTAAPEQRCNPDGSIHIASNMGLTSRSHQGHIKVTSGSHQGHIRVMYFTIKMAHGLRERISNHMIRDSHTKTMSHFYGKIHDPNVTLM